MNWFDNVSSDCDQPIAPARLMEGHWRHRLHPYGDLLLCRVVIDAAEPRVVAAQVMDHGVVEDLDSSDLEDLTQVMQAEDVFLRPQAWGFSPCSMLPDWARPSFSESQIAELERIQGYLIEASEDTVDNVLELRDEFLRGIGVTDKHMHRAVRQNDYDAPRRKGGRNLVN
ncbi:hypothetical protein [Aquabacterium sp.]|uniref:hypothetical protein n=1 Tax=Aquabacterium sp. TaxID=1872578 RepID=UPI002E3711E8|nr:hypothetical protein [Aquabacterium sp.]HEX5311103.1 hypothetical protein [Aquabacterium sp.]